MSHISIFPMAIATLLLLGHLRFKAVPQDLSFVEAAQSLSRKMRVCLVFEGQPLHLENTFQSVNSPETGDGAIDSLATQFDYTVTKKEGSLYTLTKTYRDPEDLPAVTFAETLKSLQKIAASTNHPTPATSFDIMSKIYTSPDFDKTQLEKGVKVSDLNENQQRVLFQFASSFAFRGLESLDYAIDRLQGCRNRKTHFKRTPFQNLEIPMYEGPIGPLRQMARVALSYYILTQPGSMTTFEADSNHAIQAGGKIVIKKPDPTTPRPANAIPSPTIITTTLGELASAMNQRLGKANSLTSQINVDETVASKPIFVTGAEFTTDRNLLEAVATIYGLRVAQRTDNTLDIGPPPSQFMDDGRSVKQGVMRLLPAAFVRAIEGGKARETETIKKEIENLPEEQRSKPAQYTRYAMALRRSAMALYITAMRNLREQVEPELDKREGKLLSFDEASPKAQDLVALTTLAIYAPDFFSLRDETPSYITHFKESVFTIKFNKTDTDLDAKYSLICRPEGVKGSGVAGNMGVPLTALH